MSSKSIHSVWLQKLMAPVLLGCDSAFSVDPMRRILRNHLGMASSEVDADRYALCALLVEELDIGVVVCADGLKRVRFANREARLLVPGLDRALPLAIRHALLEVLSRVACGGFSMAQAVEMPDSRKRLFVRAKPLGGNETLVTIAGARMRNGDLEDLLRSRHSLSARQCTIVACVRRGLSNAEIARELDLSIKTVKNYLSDIFTAVGVKSRTQLLASLAQMSSSVSG